MKSKEVQDKSYVALVLYVCILYAVYGLVVGYYYHYYYYCLLFNPIVGCLLLPVELYLLILLNV